MGPTRQREALDHGRTKVTTPDGRIFTIDRLIDPNDPRVDESHHLIQAFDSSAVDSLDTIRTAMRGVVVGDEASEDIPLLVHVIEDRNGLTVGTAHSAILPFRDDQGEDSETSGFLLDAYEFIKESARDQGLGTELWRQRLIDAATHAADRGLSIEAIVAEAPAGTEAYLNRIGLQRCYYEAEDGCLHEVPYRQLVLASDWDKTTGRPLEDKRPVPFHLMIACLDQRQVIRDDELLGIVRGIVGYDSEQESGYFTNTLAYEVHLGIIERDLTDFVTALAQAEGGRGTLLSAQEREDYRSKHGPESVVEHVVET
ncbi:MAG: hypothetical protein QME74_07835 [Candidatus Edwardsbacteria bacterium]|nr:hypothetical protein [Candidatus Edwardsbacteria bacterium]